MTALTAVPDGPDQPPTIVQALAHVMAAVRKVTKTEFNSQQNYNFRGVDRVVNAVAQPLRDNGVIVLPHLIAERLESFETSNKKTMFRSVVTVEYRFIGPAGDVLLATVAGEGSDSLDKATSKAMSVAYRTALLQALCLPTSDPDPDSFSPPPDVPVVAQTKHQQAKARVWKLAQAAGLDVDALAAEFTAAFGKPIGEASTSELDQFGKRLGGEPQSTVTAKRGTTPRKPDAPARRDEPMPEPDPEPGDVDGTPTTGMTDPQRRKMQALYRELGVEDRDERLADVSTFVHRDVSTTNELTREEASRLVDYLEFRVTGAGPDPWDGES